MKNIASISLLIALFSLTTLSSFATSNSVDLPKEHKGSTKKNHSDALKLTIELPSSMVATNELDSGVPFQYMDLEKELYIIGNGELTEEAKTALVDMAVYDEKMTLTENYLNFTLSLMKENLTTLSNQSKIKDINSKNAKGKFMSVDGNVPGIDFPITYWMAAFEYNGMIYKFIFWTLESEKKRVSKIAKKTFESIAFDSLNFN